MSESAGGSAGTGSDGPRGDGSENGYVIIGRDAEPRADEAHSADAAADGGEDDDGNALTSMVEQPAKVMRIGTMIKQLLEEVRSAPLDDASRSRMREIYATSIRELEQGLSGELRDELERLTLPFGDESAPSDAELRVAQAQLVGWLEGLFHGIQTALMAQQMAAQAQLKQMRHALPPGAAPQQGPHGGQMPGTGQYL
ncbi:bacterial proteasome activator family protein [Tomitella gaofuii]|uniref:bacterial proteasome activator family protein n=1 Tax=Tomitella gaofuii TaxID=2760083 RepID=UPI0015FE7BE2|nr:bacterial proteasome activator family protein [Tomitella gaofuii]